MYHPTREDQTKQLLLSRLIQLVQFAHQTIDMLNLIKFYLQLPTKPNKQLFNTISNDLIRILKEKLTILQQAKQNLSLSNTQTLIQEEQILTQSLLKLMTDIDINLKSLNLQKNWSITKFYLANLEPSTTTQQLFNQLNSLLLTLYFAEKTANLYELYYKTNYTNFPLFESQFTKYYQNIADQSVLYKELWTNAQKDPSKLPDISPYQTQQHEYLHNMLTWLKSPTVPQLQPAVVQPLPTSLFNPQPVNNNEVTPPNSTAVQVMQSQNATDEIPVQPKQDTSAAKSLNRDQVIAICEILSGEQALKKLSKAEQISVGQRSYLVQFAFKTDDEKNNFNALLQQHGITALYPFTHTSNSSSFFGFTAPTTVHLLYGTSITIQDAVKFWGLKQLETITTTSDMKTAIHTALQSGTSVITAANTVFSNNNQCLAADPQLKDVLNTLAKAEQQYSPSSAKPLWQESVAANAVNAFISLFN